MSNINITKEKNKKKLLLIKILILAPALIAIVSTIIYSLFKTYGYNGDFFCYDLICGKDAWGQYERYITPYNLILPLIGFCYIVYLPCLISGSILLFKKYKFGELKKIKLFNFLLYLEILAITIMLIVFIVINCVSLPKLSKTINNIVEKYEKTDVNKENKILSFGANSDGNIEYPGIDKYKIEYDYLNLQQHNLLYLMISTILLILPTIIFKQEGYKIE